MNQYTPRHSIAYGVHDIPWAVWKDLPGPVVESAGTVWKTMDGQASVGICFFLAEQDHHLHHQQGPCPVYSVDLDRAMAASTGEDLSFLRLTQDFTQTGGASTMTSSWQKRLCQHCKDHTPVADQPEEVLETSPEPGGHCQSPRHVNCGGGPCRECAEYRITWPGVGCECHLFRCRDHISYGLRFLLEDTAQASIQKIKPDDKRWCPRLARASSVEAGPEDLDPCHKCGDDSQPFKADSGDMVCRCGGLR